MREETNAATGATRWQSRWLRGAWNLVLGQWFVIVMGLLIVFASQVQVPQASQKLKQTVVDYLAVAVIFLINGFTIPTKELVRNSCHWKLHIFVQVQCYLLTSSISCGVTRAAATGKRFLSPATLLGIIILGCLPTAIAFNTVMTGEAHGNWSMTTAQSMLGNLLGPIVTTALIKLYTDADFWFTDAITASTANSSELYADVFKQLGLSVLIPLVTGQILANILPGGVRKVFDKWKMSKLSSLALLVIIWDTYDGAFASHAFADIRSHSMVGLLFVLILLFLLWAGISFALSLFWLPREDTIAVMYLVSTKTPAMGIPLTTVMFKGLSMADQSRLRLPMVIFQAVQVSGSSLLTIPLRKWQEADESANEMRDNAV